MKSTRIPILALCSFLMGTGCRSTPDSSLGSKYRQIDRETATLKEETKKKAALSPVEEEKRNQRLDRIAGLEKRKVALDYDFRKTYKELRGEANTYGRGKFWLGTGGLCAGIAAAALTAASPANAVWIAALSGLAGGVAGMNTLSEDTGFSKKQIVAIQTDVFKEYTEAYSAITLGTLYALADANATDEDFKNTYNSVEAALQKAEALLLKLEIPAVR